MEVLQKYFISNYNFIRSLKCEKSYFFHLNYPFLKEKTFNPEAFELKKKIFTKLCKHLFPDAKCVGVNVTKSCETSAAFTKNYIKIEEKCIINAAFIYNFIYCFIDVLKYDNGEWIAYSICDKSDNQIFKNITAALNFFIAYNDNLVLKDYIIIDYSIINQNKDSIEITFDKYSVLEKILNYQSFIYMKVHSIKQFEKKEKMPDIKMGEHCIKPDKCDYYNYCKYTFKN